VPVYLIIINSYMDLTLNIILENTKGEVSYMMNKKKIRFPDLGRILIIFMVILINVAFIKSLPLVESVQAFAGVDSNKSVVDDIYKIIINKTVPILDASMNDGIEARSSQFIAYTLFKYVTKIDFNNPKTYLASEIPLIGLFDIKDDVKILNGSVGGASSDSQGSSPPKTENVAASVNFDAKPVVNQKIDAEKPAVIIYHTHTTESFTPTVALSYEMMGDHRTTDRSFNMCKVGEEMKNYIETYYGFAVYHDMTLHDYPSYDGSYDRSKPTIEKIIKKYPDAKFIIDVHRDAFDDDEAARKKMVVDIRGDQAAKIMFMIGKSNPHWQENYNLALKLNQKIEELYPGLSKGIVVKERSIYNEDVSNKALLIEVGADCNTLEETTNSAKMVAKAIGHILKSN